MFLATCFLVLPNYFRDSTRQLIFLSKKCIVKILNDFRETGMDPDKNGETEKLSRQTTQRRNV